MTDDPQAKHRHRHLRFGWWLLFLSSAFGLALEALHAWKRAAYLDVGQETRRLMWTLSHAHGTGLALLNLLFGATLHHLGGWRGRRLERASACLIAASLLMPAGFLLGGVFARAGDPGLGALLVAPGGALLLLALGLTVAAAHTP
jgi:hypothetical protein